MSTEKETGGYKIDEARLDELTACAEMFNSLMEVHAAEPEVFAVTPDVVRQKTAEYSAVISRGLGTIFVARNGDAPVAMAAAYIKHTADYFQFSKYGLIADVFVKPGHRRKGLARSLAKACIDYFRDRNISTVRLTNAVDNEAADETWEALGFREVLKIRVMNITDRAAKLEEERIPCVDETCVGTVGPDGRCRYCGRPGPGRGSGSDE